MLTSAERKEIMEILKGSERLDLLKWTITEWEEGSDVKEGVKVMLDKYPDKPKPYVGTEESF